MAVLRKERKYYKYQYETWTQPTLSANGNLGGYSFACTQSNAYNSEYAYLAFDSSNSTQFTTNGNTGSLTIYNPNPLNITNIVITNGFQSSYVRPISSGSIEGSNDNVTWTTLGSFTNTNKTVLATWSIDLSGNTGFYNYYRFNLVGDGSYARITEMTITALEKTIIESTSSDYDYYEDVNVSYPLIVQYENNEWTTPVQVGSDSYWYGVTYGNEKFVAVGENGYTTTSTDGVTWTKPKKVDTKDWNGVTYTNGKFVAVGDDGYITTSTDGLTWTTPVQVGTYAWLGVTYANGKFVAVGGYGYTTTSTDGLTWTTPVLVGTWHWRAVTYGNGKFVAVSWDGYTTTSTDGITWTTPVQVGSKDWNDVTYANGKFVAVGNGGYVTTSTDGITWTTPVKVANFLLNWRAVTYSNGKFVAVGWYNYTTTLTYYIYTLYTLAYGTDTTYTKEVMFPNVTSIGEVKITKDLIANNFTTANYMNTDYYFAPNANDTWEIVAKINSGTNGKNRCIFAPAIDKTGVIMNITTGNKLSLWLSSATTWDIANGTAGTYTITANTDYWLKITYNGSQYIYSYSTDGTTWTNDVTVSSTTKISPCTLLLGTNYMGGSNVLTGGSIDLKECYVKINNKIVWKGERDITTKNHLTLTYPNVTKVGQLQSATLDHPERLTGFQKTVYAQTPTPTFPAASASNWEWNFRFKHRATGAWQTIYGQNKSYPSGVYIDTSNKLKLQMSTSTQSVNIVNVTGTSVLEDGKWYDVKVQFTGTDYFLSCPQANGANGTTWTTIVQVGSDYWLSIAYGNGKFVAVGNSGYTSTSTDGVTWTTPKQVGSTYWNGVTYGNGKFVAVGQSGRTSTSTDGLTWTTPKAVGSNGWYGVTYANGKFVAVGSSGSTTTSTNGTTWTTPVQVGTNTWRGVTYGNGKFVAVGGITSTSGYTTTSTDGLTWTTPIQLGTNVWRAVTYGNGKFVAVGHDGNTTTSTDGETWTTLKQVDTNAWQAVTYGNGKFVALNSGGCVTTSTDGITWTTRVQVGYLNWLGVTYDNGKFVAVGDNGYTSTSSEIVKATTTKIASTGNWKLGHDSNVSSGNSAFAGELDLAHCNIKVNGEEWWNGIDGYVTIDNNNYDSKTDKIRRYL